ncbi:MAG: BON domain-containing protein [Candidatus Kuenenia sp.]|nr:BON domain-containing protein [Candidatus Kuenenia sp.]
MDKADLIKRFFVALFLAAWIAGGLGCAGSSTHDSTGEYVDDSVITTKVKAAIFNDPVAKMLQVNVETFKGVVQLSGFVDSADAAARAVEAARSVGGVKNVINKMSVK